MAESLHGDRYKVMIAFDVDAVNTDNGNEVIITIPVGTVLTSTYGRGRISFFSCVIDNVRYEDIILQKILESEGNLIEVKNGGRRSKKQTLKRKRFSKKKRSTQKTKRRLKKQSLKRKRSLHH